ncbi:MAG TPA: SusC/RagA family TonB-linked outer membrane protein, partial [Sphingobacteriaceae bacterium]
MKRYLFLIFMLQLALGASAQFKLAGKVLGADDQLPLIGATVKVLGKPLIATTNTEGNFSITISGDSAVLSVSYLGYKTKSVTVSPTVGSTVIIKLDKDATQLNEVVVSTGYQELSGERTTGSYVQIDKTLFNRSVGTDVISRLADVVPGLIFNRAGGNPTNRTNISIRGQSTISANPEPLIILDNFPYEGDLNTINPNDVESITVLKDAAAASVWGARAGNGVIVITTKKGMFNQPVQVSVNSSLTMGDKPDMFYMPAMSASDYIDIEQKLFANGYYQSAELNKNRTPLTPVVELLIAQRDGLISSGEAAEKIDVLRLNDVRNDINSYLYRKSTAQQYSLNIRGGSDIQRFYVAAGYDKNLSSSVGDEFQRLTLNASNTYALLNKKLQLTTGLYFMSNRRPQNSMHFTDYGLNSGHPIYPYARLADVNGNPQSTIHNYRQQFAEQATQNNLLAWDFKPLEELRYGNRVFKGAEYRINADAKYQIWPFLSLSVLYQHSAGNSGMNDRNHLESFYTRDLINRFTIVNTDGSFTRPVPIGDILDVSDSRMTVHNVRAQATFNHGWKKHQISGVAGAEVSNSRTAGNRYRLYGYDDEHASSAVVDYLNTYTSYVNPSSTSNRIPNMAGRSGLSDRFLSYYLNTAYTLNDRYTASVSGRLDRSNLFGVETNQKGVPLYSAGLSWNISREGFYQFSPLPVLKLKASFGYNGNIDKSLSAYTTAIYYSASNSSTGLPFAYIENPPNPELRWERVQVINTGIDFETKGRILAGSLEYYRKRGLDLIGTTPLAPQTGIIAFTGNTADTKGQGVDLTLVSKNIDRKIKWQTHLLFSYAEDKVSRYLVKPTNLSAEYLDGGYGMPLEGRPRYSIYSFKWAGLDPQTGDPQGYLDGQVSKDYATIKAGITPETIVFHGSARPLYFGALRNTFSYRGLSLSANVYYRLKYFVRKESVRYGDVLAGRGGHGDYSIRWQNPGDENFTSVPSMPLISNANRDQFYLYSEALVERGDHVRLQDISLSYDLPGSRLRTKLFQQMKVYVYANNLGILWKASDGPL